MQAIFPDECHGLIDKGVGAMRYQRATDIVRLAIRLQGTWTGLTLDDISREFGVSRRTAERMRDAVEAAFGPLRMVDRDDRKRHWQLRSGALRPFIRIAPEELAEVESAAESLDRTGLAERAVVLRELADKLRALRRPLAAEEFDADLEALMQAEGLAMRPGPRPHLERGLLSLLRDAIKARRAVEFAYISRSTRRRSSQRVQPYQPVAKVITAFDRPCIPADCVAIRAHTPGMHPNRALSGGRRNGLGARGTFATDCYAPHHRPLLFLLGAGILPGPASQSLLLS